MFVDKAWRNLDYHFLLWNYEISDDIIKELQRLEVKHHPVASTEAGDEDSQEVEEGTDKPMKRGIAEQS